MPGSSKLGATMKYPSAVFLLITISLGGCGGCGGDEAAGPDAGDDVPPDAMPEVGDPASGAWRTDFDLPGPSGYGARVEAIALDGADVYVAGTFEDAAGVPASNVARWNGSDWAPLGAGIDGWVRAIAIDGAGDLWAGVTFEGDRGLTGELRRWDGSAWTVAGTLDGAVRDLAVIGTDVVVVGEFTTAGGVAAASVARHDGATWSAVGDGTISNGVATAIAAAPTGFCVAGVFDAIGGVPAENAACWTGVAWTPLGTGLPGGIAVLARSPGGTWYAGGTITFIVDETTGAYEAGIAVLSGATWEPFEGGIDNGFINEVRAIGFAGPDVLIAGHFLTAGDSDVPARHAARWSPTGGWSELAGGLRSGVGVFLEYIRGGHELVVAGDGTVWLGGIFTQTGASPTSNVARLDPDGSIHALVGPHPILGISGGLNALAATGDRVLAAGGYFGFAGMTPAANLAELDGDSWSELGGGIDGVIRAALVRRSGQLVVAGELIVEGAPAAVAFWDDGWVATGGRVGGAGFALLEAADGDLWLGGDSLDLGGSAVTSLARLEGSTWQMGADLPGRVTSLGELDGDVIAGGLFPGGIVIESGAGWEPLGGGLDGEFDYVEDLTISPALGVVICGSFETVGGEPIAKLARWDGAAWRDLAGGVDGFGGYPLVSAVLAYGDGVFVAGGFETAGGVPAANLAWFDGAAWHGLGAGIGDLSDALLVVDDVLYAGGPFTVAGGTPSAGIAAWDFRAE